MTQARATVGGSAAETFGDRRGSLRVSERDWTASPLPSWRPPFSTFRKRDRDSARLPSPCAVSYKPGQMILPQLEAGTHGVESPAGVAPMEPGEPSPECVIP